MRDYCLNKYDYTLKNAKVMFAQRLSYNLLAPIPRYVRQSTHLLKNSYPLLLNYYLTN